MDKMVLKNQEDELGIELKGKKHNIKDVCIKMRLDLTLLREQRDYLLTCYGEGTEVINGIISLLNCILAKEGKEK